MICQYSTKFSTSLIKLKPQKFFKIAKIFNVDIFILEDYFYIMNLKQFIIYLSLACFFSGSVSSKINFLCLEETSNKTLTKSSVTKTNCHSEPKKKVLSIHVLIVNVIYLKYKRLTLFKILNSTMLNLKYLRTFIFTFL